MAAVAAVAPINEENESLPHRDVIPIQVNVDHLGEVWRETVLWTRDSDDNEIFEFAARVCLEKGFPDFIRDQLIRQLQEGVDRRPEAFEANPYADELRLAINLDIQLGRFQLTDKFEWDVNHPRNKDYIIAFSQTLVSDLGLPPAFEPLVVQEIWRQVSTYEDVVDGIADVGRRKRVSNVGDLERLRLASVQQTMRSEVDTETWYPRIDLLTNAEALEMEEKRLREVEAAAKRSGLTAMMRNTRPRRSTRATDRNFSFNERSLASHPDYADYVALASSDEDDKGQSTPRSGSKRRRSEVGDEPESSSRKRRGGRRRSVNRTITKSAAQRVKPPSRRQRVKLSAFHNYCMERVPQYFNEMVDIPRHETEMLIDNFMALPDEEKEYHVQTAKLNTYPPCIIIPKCFKCDRAHENTSAMLRGPYAPRSLCNPCGLEFRRSGGFNR